MSLENKKDVRRIVEKYRQEFPTVERPFLRRLIRLEQKLTKDSELKALDRHLKKDFEKTSKNEKPSKIPRPTLFELIAFEQIPRDPFACSLAEDHLKSNYPEWYRRNKKVFDEIRGNNWGFGGYITNRQPRNHKISKR